MTQGVGDASGDEVAERLRRHLRGQVRGRIGEVRRTAAEEDGDARQVVRQLLDDATREHARLELTANRPLPPPALEQAIRQQVLDELFGVGGLQPLLDDPRVENINVNGCDRVFVRYADGTRAQRPPVADSDQELEELIRTLAARSGVEERRFDRGSPSVSVQLPDGSRLFAVMAVTAGARPSISIRRHRFPRLDLADLHRMGMLDQDVTQLLQALVRARKNLLVTGGTAIGKTTLLRGLASAIEPGERLVTIEDAFELGLHTDERRHPDVVALQAREPNIEGQGEVSQSELVRWALRMSPDRVIVGEIRGPEVVPMCNAMSQGNDGSMATLHASSSQIAFTRLAAYAAQGAERLPLEATNLLVASAVQFVIHLAATRDGRRVVSSLREVVGADGPHVVSNEIYRPGPDRRATAAAPLRPDTVEDLAAVGWPPDPHDPDRWA